MAVLAWKVPVGVRRSVLGLGVLLLGAGSAWGQLDVRSDGSDGAFAPQANVEVNLGAARTGVWDSTQTGTGAETLGVYDATQWAVVFKYSSVNIGPNATVTFLNHPSRAPVVWLVQGDVTIGGTVRLNGQSFQPYPRLAEPGPGGFRGGSAILSASVPPSGGYGPGGGTAGIAAHGGSGSYGAAVAGIPAYGNPQIVPLIGGSGGGGNGVFTTIGGGAGGGAIIIACGGACTIVGRVEADGGNGTSASSVWSGGGSGGGIRIISASLGGNGVLRAHGGAGAVTASVGRIRVETQMVVANSQVLFNASPATEQVPPADPPLLFPMSDAPSVRILSVRGAAAPEDPRASVDFPDADLGFENVDTGEVLIETRNVETISAVTLRVMSRRGSFINYNAAPVDPNAPLAMFTWRVANVPIPRGFSTMQVRVVRPAAP
jgi:hypothetical protein